MKKKRIERLGEKVNSWTIIGLSEKPGKYIIQCDCGFIKEDLYSGLSTNKLCRKCHYKNKTEHIVGKKYYKWLVVKKTEFKRSKDFLYLCRCNCGFEKLSTKSQITCGKSKSCNLCGQKSSGKKRGKKLSEFYLKKSKSHIGSILGNFKLIKINEIKNNITYWKCKCLSCSKKIIIPLGRIKYLESCGCLRRDRKILQLSKLNETEVKAIRELNDSKVYSRKELSKLFEISLSHTTNIINLKHWKFLK